MSETVTRDAFLRGQVTVVQPREGYRAGHDAVLLAASLKARAGEALIEAGCGAGAALLCAAHRLPGARFTGVERDAAMVALCEQGIAANGKWETVEVRQADIAERSRETENSFDQAFSNPPFFEPGAVRTPAPGKTGAYLADTPLKAWVLFLLHVVAPGGRVTMIHRAAALADLLELLNPRSGEIEVLPVRPAPGAPAGRVIVKARKGLRRGPVTLYEGLTLHVSPGGALTPRASAVLDGAELDWR